MVVGPDTGPMTPEITINDNLATTLTKLMKSGTTSNPALNRLLDDYRNYHVVVVGIGSAMLLTIVLAGIAFWRRLRTSRADEDRSWTVARKTSVSFGLLSVVVALGLAVTVAANISTVVHPRQGFVGTFASLGTPPLGTHRGDLHQAFAIWLQSGNSQTPSVVQHAIDDRLAWQLPKALICSVLLVLVTGLSIHIWRQRISRSISGAAARRALALRLGGYSTVSAGLLLILMVLGNSAASVAPLALTMTFG
jgi:cytochrome bd-type quinol oxidase subunit 2